MSQITTRPVPLRVHDQLVREGLHPVLARVCAARGINRRGELEDALSGLIPPSDLLNADRAAALLADAIAAGKRMLIVADYDCDGATACAVGMRALSAFGANVGFLVPNRFEFGYGLTPEIGALAAQSKPELLITVDNGIASVEGVDAATRLGIAVIVTDHHLPGSELPRAAAIVNPNQSGCAFPSKSLAGVGVMFYVMLALRAELRTRGAFAGREEPNLGDLLDLVALGTVADVVPLDFNNRVLVTQGLRRIRAGRMQEGVRALFAVAGHDPSRASGFDLGFLLGPRLNAAGRVKDRTHRPTFAFAPAGSGEIRGSGRSIAGLHLRDALDLVAKREPGLLLRFGGHAAAAGLTLRAADFTRFAETFEAVASELLSPAQLARAVETDGSLEPAYLDLGLAQLLDTQVWGQGFPQPMFCDEFEVLGQRVVGEKHLKLKLARAGRTVEAMRFNALDPLPSPVRAAYRLSVNEFNGTQNLQLIIEHWEPAR